VNEIKEAPVEPQHEQVIADLRPCRHEPVRFLISDDKFVARPTTDDEFEILAVDLGSRPGELSLGTERGERIDLRRLHEPFNVACLP